MGVGKGKPSWGSDFSWVLISWGQVSRAVGRRMGFWERQGSLLKTLGSQQTPFCQDASFPLLTKNTFPDQGHVLSLLSCLLAYMGQECSCHFLYDVLTMFIWGVYYRDTRTYTFLVVPRGSKHTLAQEGLGLKPKSRVRQNTFSRSTFCLFLSSKSLNLWSSERMISEVTEELSFLSSRNISYYLCIPFLFFFFSTGAWTQGLHLEPLHKGFFQDKVTWTIFWDWFWIVIFLISASWVARITGVSHQRLAASHFQTWGQKKKKKREREKETNPT
jgi:hypothetical protein